MKIYSYSLFVVGLIFLGIGVLYLWSFFDNLALVEAGQKPNYLIPNTSGKSGIAALLLSVVLIKTWWGPVAFILLGGYVLYNSFLRKNAKS